MRRFSLLFLALTPAALFACAEGSTLGRRGDGGSGQGGGWGAGAGADWGSENDNEGDAGSSDPGAAGGDPGGDPGGDTGGGELGGACVHDPCVAGAPLVADCHPCVAEVCAKDAFCCQGEWDDTCIGQATSCNCAPLDPGGNGGAGGAPDPGGDGGAPPDPGGSSSSSGSGGGPDPDPGGGTCTHGLCIVGEPLDPGCDPCVAEICSNVDPYCCDVEWDLFCLGSVIDTCPLSCL